MKTFSDSSKWIGMPECPGRKNAPLLRREFTVKESPVSASLRISGLGYYEAWINGLRVGDHLLDPAQTDYEVRTFFVEHDVSRLIQTGANTIGVILGNGWYNQDRVWGENGFSYGKPKLLAELKLQFADGSALVIGSDEQWGCAPGPITDNNVYAGECYDATLEQAGWNTPGFDVSEWEAAVIVPGPGGRLERQNMPPIRRIEDRSPLAIRKLSTERYVVDMGQNLSGWVRIRVQAPAHTEIRMRFAEALAPDGGIDTASTGVFATHVEQVDSYTCKGEGTEVWEPRFTYHGFRYVELTGWPGEPGTEDITGVVVHTDLPVAGEFHCSDERLNRLHSMALWTHRSNIHGIPEDCPVRERCGWLGDANVVAEFSMWNFQGLEFWKKYLDDIETTRSLNGGLPCNIAPGQRNGGVGRPDWAATFILLPWYVYVHYGDSSVLQKHWDGMKFLMDHFCEQADNGILDGGFGDWFDPGGETACTHTPPILTTTVWFHQCACVMASVAALLKKQDQAAVYERQAVQTREAFIKQFYHPETGSFGSQTADVLALQFGLAPPDETERVVQSLVRDIKNRGTHLNTGIMGLRFLFEVLTRNGHGDLAIALMHQDTYPGFGDLIRRGATTLWEYWGEANLDEFYGPRSLSHPMMGGYDNWFYNTLAGIRPDPAHPGFKQFFLEPHPVPGLEQVETCYESPLGRIESRWTFRDGLFEWSVIIPEGSSAVATLPFSRQIQKLKPGQYQLTDQ